MATTRFGPTLTDAADIDSRYGSVLANGAQLRFGIPETNSSAQDFAVPVIKFQFRTPYGVSINDAPLIYMRAPNSLNLSQASKYNEGTGIFGGQTGTSFVENEDKSQSVSFLGSTAKSFTEALASKIFNATAGASNYLLSAGQSGTDNFEFTNRSIINPFQQLLYKGPVFKQYNLPFVMRPKNLNEARAAMAIISSFKIAASAKITQGAYVDQNTSGSALSLVADKISDFTEIAATFGYPDLVDFELLMYTKNSESATLYQSLSCAIQSVNTDYGQQKMTFFIPESGSTEYYPTEITMTLSLQEVAVRSVKNAIDESADMSKTIR